MKTYPFLRVEPEEVDFDTVQFRSHPNLMPHERETYISMDDESDAAVVSTEQRVWANHLLGHPCFTVETVWRIDETSIAAIEGILPKNCVRTSRSPRERFHKL